MLQNIRLRTKVLLALLVMSSIPLLVIGPLLINTANQALSDLAFRQLESLRDVKKTHVERFFEERRRNLGALLQTVSVFEQTAFEKLRTVQEGKKAQVEEYFRKLRNDIAVLSTNVSLYKLKDFEILLDGQGGIKLATLDLYEKQYFGAALRQLAHDYEYDDVLLITDKGNVVYSVARGPELGQNLLSGALKNSPLAASFKRGLSQVSLQDFAAYAPAKGAPVAFIAAPVVNAQLKATVGVVVLRIGTSAMNRIVQRRGGMGVSGDTYLVGRQGKGFRLRTDQVINGGKVDDAATGPELERMLTAGAAGTAVSMGRSGTMELLRHDPLQIRGLNWGIVTVMNLEEAITPRLGDGQRDYFAQFTRQYGYSDLHLIHPDGTVFYTVSRRPDYGTNLRRGPYATTGLGQAFRRSLESAEASFADYQAYAPFGGKPAAFMTQPLLHNGRVELVVAVQIPIDAINAVMQERSGMGQTGETYLVGPDGLMRSD